jgi:iron complex outermembrane receptor protein
MASQPSEPRPLACCISIWAVLAVALCAVLCPAPADSQSARADPDLRRIDIPAGDLNTALKYLATRSGTGLVYRPEQVQGVKTRGVQGAPC